MEARRPTAAERERAERELAQQRSRLSLRLGGIGIVVLFASGLGAWLATAYVIEFLAGMVIGILLLLGAFLLLPRTMLRLRMDDQTKIL